MSSASFPDKQEVGAIRGCVRTGAPGLTERSFRGNSPILAHQHMPRTRGELGKLDQAVSLSCKTHWGKNTNGCKWGIGITSRGHSQILTRGAGSLRVLEHPLAIPPLNMILRTMVLCFRDAHKSWGRPDASQHQRGGSLLWLCVRFIG